jgi:hypothetical protein
VFGEEEVARGLRTVDCNLTSSAGQDLTVVMFSGHGAMIDNQFYRLPYGSSVVQVA